MNNPTTEEIVKSLKICASSESMEECLNCIGCGETVCAAALLYAAAERLEALEAELAAVKEKQRWRPVTEPPKETGLVWVKEKRRDNSTSVHLAVYCGDLGWMIDGPWYTHWAPLLEPPKEESK